MKRLAFITMAVALFAACTTEGGEGTNTGEKLSADFTISANPVVVGEEVTFTAKAEGGTTPYTFTWELGSDYDAEGLVVTKAFETNGGKVIKLTVVDGAGEKIEKRKNLVVNPKPVDEIGNVTLKWAARIPGYNTISTPAIADDGSIYATSQAGILYKFDSNGNKLWEYNTERIVKGTPSIDTDGTVYLGAGSGDGKGAVLAINPGGSLKWSFTDFYASEGSTLAPTMQGALIGIGTENVYFGNCGTTGAVLAAKKSDGTRLGYVTSVTGGCRVGVTVSKSGYIHCGGGKYGVFGIQQSRLDAASNSGIEWDWRYYDVQGLNNAEGPIALAKINGKTCVVGVQTSNTDNTPWVYAVNVEGDEPKLTDKKYAHAISEYVVEGGAAMDNGSVAVTAEGYVVATLNCNNGTEDGGIIVVDLSKNPGELKAEYRVMEKVSGAPAIDAAGNIHFGTESGNYYVVDKDCKLIAKRELAALVNADTRYAESLPFEAAKVYSSIVIGDDGKVYLQFTNNDSDRLREFGALVCLEVDGCTAPGNTDWPMMGQNRRHTNCEK